MNHMKYEDLVKLARQVRRLGWEPKGAPIYWWDECACYNGKCPYVGTLGKWLQQFRKAKGYLYWFDDNLNSGEWLPITGFDIEFVDDHGNGLYIVMNTESCFGGITEEEFAN